MIEGLKVTVAGTELKQLCEKRAEFHEQRAKFYAKQKKALPAMDENIPEFSNTSKQPQQMMKERLKSHEGEAAELRFIAAHIDKKETFLLTRDDLYKLGITSRGY